METKIRCPLCRRTVTAEQVNMATDLALCPACNHGFKVSENFDFNPVNSAILSYPPKGAWFRKEIDRTVIGASTRSPAAFFLVPFMCAWSGFSLGGIYGRQIINGEFDLISSFLGIPFVIGTVLLGGYALMMTCGKVEVSIGRTSSVLVGIGYFGWKRSFDWPAVRSIREEQINGSNGTILVEGNQRLKFGTGLNDQRRHFILHALKHLRGEMR